MPRHFLKLLPVILLGMAPASLATAQGVAGPYLAAEAANLDNDYREAARDYADALRADPSNRDLMELAIFFRVAAGDAGDAIGTAEELVGLDPNDRVAALVLIVDAIRKQDYGLARDLLARHEKAFSGGGFGISRRLAQADFSVLDTLTKGLLDGWIEIGGGSLKAGLDAFAELDSRPAQTLFAKYNAALAFAQAGDFSSAVERISSDAERLARLSRESVFVHVESLAQTGDMEGALALLSEWFDLSEGGDPDALALDAALRSGEERPYSRILTPSAGAAEALYALAQLLFESEPTERLALFYARLAEFIEPQKVSARLLIADILKAQGQYDDATRVYATVTPQDPEFPYAELGRADALAESGRLELAASALRRLTEQEPKRLAAHVALGDTLRRAKMFEECGAAYDGAVSLLVEDAPPQWQLYYTRGICRERAGQWEAAEADMRKALDLSPGQPLVLNYLGYSMVEKLENLEEAEDMIRQAVANRPDDGFITDSLGWVLYRLGRFEEAVEPMERAVELEPVDPIINDHLGDVYWMVGRKREAEFQWSRALSFEPEPEDAERIRAKLDRGLDEVLKEEAAN